MRVLKGRYAGQLVVAGRARSQRNARGGGGLELEGRRQLRLGLVVAGKTVDTGLDKNEAELGVLVVTVALEVLADGDGLLDEVVKVLGDLGGEAWATTRASVTQFRLELGDVCCIPRLPVWAAVPPAEPRAAVSP